MMREERCIRDARACYEDFKQRRLNLNLARGKPSPEQLDLSNALLSLPANADFLDDAAGDARNYYGGLQGLPEARELFSKMLGAPKENMLVANNSSLAIMHDCIVYALLTGFSESSAPWRSEDISFVCPVPGYDRHFRICETYGIRMIPVGLTGQGPDMDEVERLVSQPSVKGMWCVPKYSNPTGEVYSAETVRRIAEMKVAAPDFRVFWDNAYAVHHLTDVAHEVDNILDACRDAGSADRPLVFGSTSKMTFAGGGLGLFASSESNMRWLTERMSVRTIGPEKLNQLRHVRFLKDHSGVEALMKKHRRIIAPKFAAFDQVLSRTLGKRNLAEWSIPMGGYFISVDVPEGCARRVVTLCREAGLELVPAGSAFPYRQDPHDRNIRIAPTFPSVAEVELAAEIFGLSILLAADERHSPERQDI